MPFVRGWGWGMSPMRRRMRSAIALSAVAMLGLAPSALAQVSFSAATDYAVGNTPQSVAVGDLNGDGGLDLAVANNLSGDVSVLLGNGAGGFGAATSYPVGVGAASVAIGDFNGDVRPDLAVANISTGVVVLLNTGAGLFVAGGTYPAGTTSINVAVGDLNGDSKPDLAVANEHSHNVSVLLGDGAGGFSPAVTFPTDDFARWVAAADLNGDGQRDLAVANLEGANVSVLIGDGAGGFAAAVHYPLPGGFPTSLAVGDVNGDGRPDLVASDAGIGGVWVLLGDGSGVFGAATNFPTATKPTQVVLSDLNGDGTLDAVLANFLSSAAVSVLLGDGAGGFGAPSNFPAGTLGVSVAVADFDGDGKPDLALARQGMAGNVVSVLLNTTGAYSQLVLAHAAAGYWRFGEPSGTFLTDSSGNGNHGTYIGGVQLGVPGSLAGDADTAARYDGINDQGRVLDTPTMDVGNTFTAEGWVRRTIVTKSHEMMNKGANGIHLVVMSSAAGNRVVLRRANVGTIAQSTSGVPGDGDYHHVAATMNGIGSTARIYIDGVNVTQTVSSGQTILDTAFPMTFGSFGSAPATPADYDEFAIYDSALTAPQIQAHYDTGIGVD